jgi:tRNA 2-selenouridine synthase
VKAPQRISIDEALAPEARFDAIVDARSPAEFADDHMPGAVNAPVLDDAERALVGTIYKQQSAFVARRTGAAIVSRNIASLLEHAFADRPPQWRPLVHCWRGGNRSDALATVFAAVGWRTSVLDGGYREFRRHVIAGLAQLPSQLRWHVVAGPTGSGKSRVLQRLGERGEQVLDLEAIARHRGSVLGLLPDEIQPSQKAFETATWDALRRFDFPVAPLVVGLILGPMMEQSMRQALTISQGEWSTFVVRPLSGSLLAIALLLLVAPKLWALRHGIRAT